MDNVCHSLAGAAIAQASFARRLPRATLAAVVAANIPDVDAFTYLGVDSAFAVSFRRGWTHGIPALIVWALLLGALFARVNRRRPAEYFPLVAIAVVSHPALDWLNTYGVRFLMPFSNTWFYGDTLFIVDPTLIALFFVGWFWSSRMLAAGSRRAELPARVALVVALVYVAAMQVMAASTLDAARAVAARTARLSRDAMATRAAMVAPAPFSYSRRSVLLQHAAIYDEYVVTWTTHGPEVLAGVSSEPSGDDPAVRARVLATVSGERFLRWSRFPYFVPGTGAEAGTIFVGDMRYSAGTTESWAGIRVAVRAVGRSSIP